MKHTGFLLLLFSSRLIAQDITGLWIGSFYNDTTQQTIQYEVAIGQSKNKYTAYSHTTFIIDGSQAIGVKSIKVVKQKDRYFFEDVELLFNNYPVPPPKGVKQLSALSLSENGDVLNGKFITTRTKQYGRQVTGTVQLTRKKDIKNDKLITKLEELGFDNTLSFLSPKTLKPVALSPKTIDPLPKKEKIKPVPAPVADPLKELAKRKIETVETVLFSADSLQLILYDNGFVDGDSVSVIINGNVVLQHQRLSQQPITKTIAAADSLQIIMYAENLGSIAPNTGLLIIYDGSRRHEIRFEGDLQKNAAVVLRRTHGKVR